MKKKQNYYQKKIKIIMEILLYQMNLNIPYLKEFAEEKKDAEEALKQEYVDVDTELQSIEEKRNQCNDAVLNNSREYSEMEGQMNIYAEKIRQAMPDWENLTPFR